MDLRYSNIAWYLVHALLGAVLGFITSVIFLAFYYGTVFDTPVSDALRLKSAIISTAIVVVITLAIIYRRTILNTLRVAFSEGADRGE